MKKFLLTLLALLMITAQIEAATPIKKHPRIAVAEFTNKAITSEGFRDQDYSSATEYAIYQLSASDWFDLIDYEQMITVARMHSINRSGMFDPATVPQLGKFLAAEYILVGSLTGMTVKESGLSVGAAGAKAGGSKYTVTANVTGNFADCRRGHGYGYFGFHAGGNFVSTLPQRRKLDCPASNEHHNRRRQYN